jgi:tetratricopeptide (TPR) repeat protein
MTPTRAVLRGFLLAACLPLAAGPAAAHGLLHEQIAALTAQIDRDPRDARLYLRRGELYGHHGETEAALADFDRAKRLNPALSAVDLSRGKVLVRTGRLAEAKEALDRFLAAQPDDPDALSTRARTHAGLGQPKEAVEDYTSAIRAREKRGQALPDDYLERARVLAARGGEHAVEALRGLDGGVAQLGPLVSLELYAIDLELAAGRHQAALARLEAVAAQSQRKEPWLIRRAEILERAGRAAEARLAYEQVAGAIDALPSRHRRTRATLELESRAREGLARLQAGTIREGSP